MASKFDDTVLDFDLNFLQQPPTVVNDYKYDKQRKSILIAKKKTIATDSLIRKYYAKNEQFEHTEVLLLAAKEECKQACIDYKETLEKCSQMEKDAVILKTRNKELEDSNVLLQNQCDAIKSHANQLQVLVDEHETTIEGLKIETQLNKNNTKDSVTKLTELQNDNETLLKHLCLIRDIVIGKKKLKQRHKLLLKKYDKFKYDSDGEEFSEDSNEESLFFDSLPPSPMLVNNTENKKEVTLNVNRNSNLVKKVIEDHESDCSNEVVSEDTGRGSSLAFSDGEKCFNSPDYFQNDSPFATDATKVKDKRTFADIGTNPIYKEFKHVGTSPIVFEQQILRKIDMGVQVGNNANKLEIISNVSTKENLINRATSPIPDIETSASSALSKDAEKVYIDKGIQVDSDAKKIRIVSDVIVKEKHKLISRATSPIADVDISSSAIKKDVEKVSDSINTLQPPIEMSEPANSLFLSKTSEHSNSCDDSSMTAVSQDDVSINDNEQDSDIKDNCLTETLKENAVNTSRPNQINIQDLTSQCEIEFSGNSSSIKEKMCLERNNSKNINSEGINDTEIEMILNTMRLTERLITPIPKTPAKLRRKKSNQLISPVPEKSEPLNSHTGCVEALKVKEDNKTLKSSISDLSKEIMKIKRILKNHMLMPESPKNDKNKTIMSDFEDSSQDTLVINVNNNVKRTVDLSEDLPLSKYIWEEKESEILQNVTDVRVSPGKHDSIDNMIVADTNESGKKSDTHTPKNNSRANNHEHIINNDKEIISQDHSEQFSDAETPDEDLRKRKMNAIKLSRLEKFRKKLVPKGKIPRIKAPIRKLQTKPKSIQKLVNTNNLNNKTAFEKAVNIMKELKLKELSKENDVLQSKKQSETESKKKDDSETVALNLDLVESSECSSYKEVPIKIAQHAVNKNILVNIAQHTPSKEDLVQSTQPLINKNSLVKTPCSSDKEYLVKNGQCSPNKNNSVKILHHLGNKRDLLKVPPHSLSKEISNKNAHCLLSMGDLDKLTQPIPDKSYLPSKELSVKTGQPSPNKNNLTNIQFLPNKDVLKNGKYSPNNDDSFKSSLHSPSKEVLVETPQSLPNTNDLVKITPCSPTTEDSVKTELCIPTKEDSLNNIKQTTVCLSQTKLDTLMNKDSRHECNSETIQNVLKITHSPQHHASTHANYITTRSRSKMSDQESITSSRKSSTESMTKYTKVFGNEGSPSRKRKQSNSETSSEISCKRVLRSSNVREIVNNYSAQNQSPEFVNKTPQKRKYTESENSAKSWLQTDISKMFPKCNEPFSQYDISKELNDAGFDDMITTEPENHPKQSILCKMIDKYGKATIRFIAKKVPDSISNAICKKLEDNIAHIIELPPEKAKPAMSKFVDDIQHNFNLKNFLCGFLKYLKDPARKAELFKKVASPPAPPMSKSEQVVLYIVKQLSASVPDIVNIILMQIEFSLFQFKKTPEFEVIESLSHIYALICRYFGLKMRLRLFILDAMYCLSFKVVPLIKQCLDVWMHILPLAHMGIAKTPLVTCLVYLLHFYKCEDRFNRVQDIRLILHTKYFYQVTEWTEPNILELFRTSVLEIRDISVEKKTLRMALIILAKRQGPEWCQKNIIKKMLMPLIEKEDIPLRVKQFSIQMLGPLLKPYPANMKVHCEIVGNKLLDMLDLNPQDSLKESIFTSLIYMSKHNQNRVLQALLSWKPKHVTPEFELLLKDYVQEKSLKVWKRLLSRITF